jgi:hypothetical protein
MWHFLLQRGWGYLGYLSGQTLMLWTPVWSVWWAVGVGLALTSLCCIGMVLWKN